MVEDIYWALPEGKVLQEGSSQDGLRGLEEGP